MDNGQNVAPVIPAGTERMGTAAYNPLAAAQRNVGQTTGSPNMGQSQAVQPGAAQSGEPNAPQGTTFDELAVKKGFKSADDLAAAYENLESQNKRVEMGLAELTKLREQSPEILPEELNTVQTQEDALKVVERVVKKFTRPLEDKLALQELFYQNADAQQYAAEMAKVVKENPGISWNVAYRAAKFDTLEKQSREKGKQEAYQVIQQKQKVAVEPARASVSNARPLNDLIKDKTVPFYEVQRIMKERFSP